ncbi:hypothetical protein ZWY2020_055384 [Hordeum vulgare]|nr:hypothetical protein ZWY2020_055384 [Hordeum vulgare]
MIPDPTVALISLAKTLALPSCHFFIHPPPPRASFLHLFSSLPFSRALSSPTERTFPRSPRPSRSDRGLPPFPSSPLLPANRHLPTTTTTTSGRSLSLPPRPRNSLPFPTAPLRLGRRRIRISVSLESSEEGGGSTNGSLSGLPPVGKEEEDDDESCPVECVTEFKTDEYCKYIEQGFMKLCKYIKHGFMKLCKGSGNNGSPVIFLKHNVINEYDEQSEVTDRLRIKVMQTEVLVRSVVGRHGVVRLTQNGGAPGTLARDTCEPKDEPTQMEKRQEQSALNTSEAEGKPAEMEVCQE